MSEESILILNMLREGKVTAEQADSLLRAVRETPVAAPVPPVPPTPPTPPAPPSPDPAMMASMQARLAELQGKLGEIQGKLGAAQTARSADGAASLAGKILDHIPRPELDMGKINKAVDEAMRGLNSLKNDAVKTARTAGRQAAEEAKKAAREGRRAMKREFNVDLNFGGEPSREARPVNAQSQPEAADTTHDTVSWSGAETLAMENKYGSLTVRGTDTPNGAATATVTKTAWADTEDAARVLLQQVFLTHTVESGQCRVGVAAPADARDRLTVDVEISVPRSVALDISTQFGAVSVEEAASALSVKTASGSVSVVRPFDSGTGAAELTSASGDLRLSDWNLPRTALTLESSSGDIVLTRLSVKSAALTSRSGDMSARETQCVETASYESSSGDVLVSGSAAGARASVRSGSGAARVDGLRAEQVHIETISGDAHVQTIGGTLTVKTISGDVEASDTETQNVSLMTVSGDVQWALPVPFAGSFAGTTVSGDLKLRLSPASDARLEMNTTSGSLNLGLPTEDAVTSERHITGRLGGGTGSIRLQSVSGDLDVEAG